MAASPRATIRWRLSAQPQDRESGKEFSAASNPQP